MKVNPCEHCGAKGEPLTPEGGIAWECGCWQQICGSKFRSVKCRDEQIKRLDELLTLALPYVEEAATDPVNKPAPVKKLAKDIRTAIGAP